MKRQVVFLWTCLLFLSFLSSLSLKATGSLSMSPVTVKSMTETEIKFTLNFTTTDGKLDVNSRNKFSFQLNYKFNSTNEQKTLKDSTKPPQAETSQPFYIYNGTTLQTPSGPYNVIIRLNPGYNSGGSPFPKKLTDITELTIKVLHENNPLDGANNITFEVDKNVKYNLGNESYVKNLVVAPTFKEALLKTLGSKDKILLFNDKDNTVKNTEETQTLSSQPMDLILFDLEGIDNQDTYDATSTKPNDLKKGFEISSRFFDLLDVTTNKRIEKAPTEEWLKTIPPRLQSSQKTECYFIFPPASLADNKSYECIRCNFNTSTQTSTDQAYLIESSSFSEGTNHVVKKFTSRDVSKGQSFQDLENGRRYAVLPLFSGKTMINYKIAKDPTSNSDSKIMCEIFSPEDNYTLTDYLNSGNDTEKGDPRCFIVSAAYGSAFEPQVDTFRWFRDQVILKTSLGEKFMDFYYNNSEPVANFIATSEVLKFSVRTILWPFAIGLHVLKFLVDTPSFLLFLSFSFLAFFVFRNVFMKKT